MRPPIRTPAPKLPEFSLRFRIALWLLLVSFLVQAALGAGVVLYERVSLGRLSDERIRARADFIAGALKRSSFKVTDEDLGGMASDSLKYALLDTSVVALYSGSGEPLASSLRPAPSPDRLQLLRAMDGPAAVALSTDIAEFDVTPGTLSKPRMVLQRVSSEDGREFVLLLAASDTYYQTMMLVITRALLILIPIGTLISAFGAWAIAGLAVAPLRQLRLIADSFDPAAIEDDLELPPPKSLEMRSIEQRLRVARSQLRAALHSQDRFISSVSHELNTPIAVLLIEAQTLDRNDLTPAAERFVGSVTDEMRRLGRIVESFLTLTRLRCNQPLLRFKPCGVNDFVMDAVENCAKFAARSGITLVPRLALGEHPPTVSGEGELLSVMVDNLVRNAIRFSPSGQQVVISVVESDNSCTLTVRDFGKGCPEDVLTKLSERFLESPGQLIVGRGHGRGLSIAQSIAVLHGGMIGVRNMHKEGCEFSITLPLAPTLASAPALVPA